MTDGDIAYEKRGSVGLIGFDRPEKRNAFTVHMFHRLAEVCTAADDDDDVRAIVIYGKGTDTTTGLDLMNVGPSFRAGEVPIPAELVDPWHVVGRLRRTPMVTAVHGRCFTLGTEIALSSCKSVHRASKASDRRPPLTPPPLERIVSALGSCDFGGNAG